MTAQAAMHRAYAAWRNTQAQLELVLDETAETLPGGLVEHQRSPAGAEPCCGPLSGRSDGDPVAAPPATSGGSAPSPPPER